ncbi:DUF4162 domain-containing protein [Dehalococcoidia bacterium]|nr:DUF4162 domain-containing protein [Dehalococcoidia bacterium]
MNKRLDNGKFFPGSMGEGIDFDLPGIIQKETSDKIVKLLYNGDINLLLARLSEINLKNLWIEEPSLEEIFMHYYHR